MKPTLLLSYLLILFATACVDRLYSDIKKTVGQGISVTGFISDQPGPYEVRLSSVFDIESKETSKILVSARILK